MNISTAVKSNFVWLGILCLVLAIGCGGRPEPSDNQPAEPVENLPPIKVLVVDDASLAKSIQRQWQARGERPIEVSETTLDELYSEGELTFKADVLIYPPSLLGELVEQNQLLAIPSHELARHEFDRGDLLPADRGSLVSWGEQTYACSLGCPQMVLLYRKDLFDQLGLDPPETWPQYQALVEKLSDRTRFDDQATATDLPWSGTLEPLTRGWAGKTLLMRAAPYFRQRSSYSGLFDFDSMDPLVDRPPFVRALQQLVAARQSSQHTNETLDPVTIKQHLAQGQAAMALVWLSGGGIPQQTDQPGSSAIAIANVPGATDVYQFSYDRWEERHPDESNQVPLLGACGRLGSVARRSRRSGASFRFLAWLGGKQMSETVCAAGQNTAMSRHSHLVQPARWIDPAFTSIQAEGYAEIVKQNQQNQVNLMSLRIPGRRRYLAALDQAVHDALAGTKTAQQALTDAAETWREITQSLGVDRQLKAYHRSLGVTE